MRNNISKVMGSEWHKDWWSYNNMPQNVLYNQPQRYMTNTNPGQRSFIQ